MAKKRKAGKTPKRRSAPKLTFLTKRGVPRKDEKGRFVSKEDWSIRGAEIRRRLASQVEREQELARQRKVRQREVERLRKVRHQRSRTKSGRTRAAFKTDTETQRTKRELETERDRLLVDAGIAPKPFESRAVGKHKVALWRWYGDSAIELAGDFIRDVAREKYGDATMGRVAVGTNYGKNGQWVGTRTLPLYDPNQRDDLWWALERLTATVSGKEVMGTPDDGMNEVWVEVELILPGR